MKALADYKNGKEEQAVEETEDLIALGKSNDGVIVPVATILVLAGQTEKALEILRELHHSLEGYVTLSRFSNYLPALNSRSLTHPLESPSSFKSTS